MERKQKSADTTGGYHLVTYLLEEGIMEMWIAGNKCLREN